MGATQKNGMYMYMRDTKPIRCVSSVKTLQHIAIHCNTQKWGALDSTSFAAAVTKHYITLHHIATPYNTLQHTATNCNALQQNTVAHCSTLQH